MEGVSRPSSLVSVVTSSGNERCDPVVRLVRGSNPTHPLFAVPRVFPGSPTVVTSWDRDSCDRTWVGWAGVGGVSWWDHRTRWFTTRAEPTHARVRLCGGKRKPRRARSETEGVRDHDPREKKREKWVIQEGNWTPEVRPPKKPRCVCVEAKFSPRNGTWEGYGRAKHRC